VPGVDRRRGRGQTHLQGTDHSALHGRSAEGQAFALQSGYRLEPDRRREVPESIRLRA